MWCKLESVPVLPINPTSLSGSQLVDFRCENILFEPACNKAYLCNRPLHMNFEVTFYAITHGVCLANSTSCLLFLGFWKVIIVIVFHIHISLSDGLAVALLGVLFIDKTEVEICQQHSKLSIFTTCLILSCQVFWPTRSTHLNFLWNLTLISVMLLPPTPPPSLSLLHISVLFSLTVTIPFRRPISNPSSSRTKRYKHSFSQRPVPVY
jgi:uncharacterized membrane protein